MGAKITAVLLDAHRCHDGPRMLNVIGATRQEVTVVFTRIFVQQPQPNDIVGSQVLIGGQATGYEATVSARVRDRNGLQLASTFFMSGGGGGEIGPFQTQITLPGRPPTPNGFVEVFEDNAAFPDEGPYEGPVAEFQKVIVPVVFGSHLVSSYVGFGYHMVVEGESLSAIAASVYGVASEWPAIYEANRDQIGDPNLIYSGQLLRIPHSVAPE